MRGLDVAGKSWSEVVDAVCRLPTEITCAPCPGDTCAAAMSDGWSISSPSHFGARFDHLTRAQLAEVRLALAGLKHVIYSTHSHLRGGKDDNCVAILLPLSRPVPAAADRGRLFAALTEAHGLPLGRVGAGEQPLPCHPRGNEFVFESRDGVALDVDALLAMAPVAAPAPEDPRPQDGGSATRREAALAYAARGWRVFRVWDVVDGECECQKLPEKHPARKDHVGGRGSPGKHPVSGQGEATTDPEVIGRWWPEEHPDAWNVGAIPGECSGYIAIDVDPRNDGEASLERLVAEHGAEWLETVAANTGSGGAHFYFKWPTDGAARSWQKDLSRAGYPGIDVLHSHAPYDILPPSAHYSGGRYEWVVDYALGEREMLDAPEWLLALATGPAPPRTHAPVATHAVGSYPPATPDVLEAARDALRRHGPSVFKQKGDAHAVRAGAIALNDWGLTWGEAEPLAREWNEGCRCPARPDGWAPDALERKWHNGLKYATGPYGAARDKHEGGKLVTESIAKWHRANTAGDDARAEAQRRFNMLRTLRTRKGGEAINCISNIDTLIECFFPECFRFNAITKDIEVARDRVGKVKHAEKVARAGTDTLPDELAIYLSRDIEHDDVDIAADPSRVASALLTIARRYSYNPLTEYLRALKWDGVSRLDTWLETYAKVVTVDEYGDDVSEYVRMVGTRWLLSAVARALHPGCKADCVLVLYSEEQGLYKSTVFDILGGPWFSDTPILIGQKDGSLAAGASWIHELGELDSLRKSETEAQKTFLSSRIDKFRLPYARAQQDFPRMCVFGGTTNAREFLTDRTGNRRFWAVCVGARADVAALRRDRDQLLAEAVHRLHNASRPELCRGADHEQGPGERWWLEPDEEKVAASVARKRMTSGVVESYAEAIAQWLGRAGTACGLTPEQVERGFTTSEVADLALKIPAERHSTALQTAVGHALRTLGYAPCGRARRYKPVPPPPGWHAPLALDSLH